MSNPSSDSSQNSKPAAGGLYRFIGRLADSRFFTASLLLHVLIVVLVGGTVLFKVSPAAPDFEAGSEGIISDSAENNAPPDAPPVEEQQTFTPTQAEAAAPALAMLLTTSPTAAVINAAPLTDTSRMSDNMNNAIDSASKRAGDAAAAAASAAMGRAGGMAKVNFFGVKTEAKRIAFLVDYSGSMEGDFRKEMESELEKCLKGLPASTPILIIPWAGGAWLYDQVATDIQGKWQKLGNFDDFAVKPGEKLKHPEYVPTNPENVKKLMKGVEAQKSWPGGTDWRSPFRYAMEANPPPDTIFFMTDGQIGDAKKQLDEIDLAIKKAPKPPTVFCFYIISKNAPDSLKTLAKKYKGEFKEVGSKKNR